MKLPDFWCVPLYATIGMLAGILLFLSWWHHASQPSEAAPVNVWTSARKSDPVKEVEKHPVVIKTGKIKTYPPAVKDGLKLPPAVQDDPHQQVIEATHVAPDDHATTVTTIVDTETGETNTITRREPLPWLAWSDRGSVGLYAGLKNGDPATRLQAHQELFSVKAVRFGVVASVDQPMSGPIGPDYFVGVGAEYRW